MTQKTNLYSLITALSVIFVFHSCIPHSVVHRKPEGYTGEWDKSYEWNSSDKKINPDKKQWQAMLDTFNRVPPQLDLVNLYFDSTLPVSQCYKFIYSPDSTKFLAFYLAEKGTEVHKQMFSKGGTFITRDYNMPDSPRFHGIVLWGMLYENRWYYHKDAAEEFHDPNITSAKNDYLYFFLSSEWFFENWLTPGHTFWNTGGKSISYLPVRVENYLRNYPHYEGMPILVAQGDIYLRETRKSFDNWLQKNIELLRQQDTVLYHEINKKSISVNILSFYQDKAISSFRFVDAAGKMWFGFVYMEMENETTVKRAYAWNKPIDRDKSLEGPQLIKYYEQFIPGWHFGNQLVKDTDFWEKFVTKTEKAHYPFLKGFYTRL